MVLLARRRLGAGGVQDLEREQDDERPELWTGEFRSTAQCGGKKGTPVDASLTIRPQGAEGGRATRFDACWRAMGLDCFNDNGRTPAVARISGVAG